MMRLLPLLFLISGCGIAAQKIFAWDTVETERVQATHQIEVKTDPPGLEVSRLRGTGVPQPIGVSPLVDVVPYEIEEKHVVHHGWLAVSVAAAEFVGGLGMALGATGGDSDSTLRFVGLALTGGILINLSIADAIWGSIRLFQKDGVEESIAGDRKVTYVAKLDEDARTATLMIPDARLTLSFPKRQIEESRVIAVMGVEDSGATLTPVLLSNISDQLRSFVAMRAKTIDRDIQDRTLIDSIKKESYASCYDEACQIELGRALAATHIIRGRVTRFGDRCILNVALVDLTREVTVNAASAQGGCQDESFLEMSEMAARDLMKR